MRTFFSFIYWIQNEYRNERKKKEKKMCTIHMVKSEFLIYDVLCVIFLYFIRFHWLTNKKTTKNNVSKWMCKKKLKWKKTIQIIIINARTKRIRVSSHLAELLSYFRLFLLFFLAFVFVTLRFNDFNVFFFSFFFSFQLATKSHMKPH